MAPKQPHFEARSARKHRAATDYVAGFPSLAAYISDDKDKSISIYRAFQRLSSRNLLYLEAELVELETEQDFLDDELLGFEREPQRWAGSWKDLVESRDTDTRAKQRIDLIIRVRHAMKEYHEALILEEAVLKMGRPHNRQIKALNYFVEQEYKDPSRRVPILSGLSERRLGDEDDLIVLSKPIDQDWLIRFVRRYFHVFFLEPNQELVGSLARISERKIAQAVSAVATFAAAALLVGAIVNLYFVTNSDVRLGLIGGYTIVFTLSVAGLTNARRSELFASTAGYAAVLAIFVGGPLANPPSGIATGG